MKKETIAAFIKRNRKDLCLTQADLALKSGVGLHFVRDLEQGKKSLHTGKINQVLFLFGAELGVIALAKGDEK